MPSIPPPSFDTWGSDPPEPQTPAITDFTPLPTVKDFPVIPENRETFLARLRPVLAPSDFLKVEIAYALVKEAHGWQTRKELDRDGNPVSYFKGHLRPTAIIAIDELGISDPNIILACLLHDSIEDTKTIHDRMLEHLFGSELAVIVKLMTKDPAEGYYDRLTKHGTWKTLFTKGCDRLSNLRTLRGCPRDFQVKQVVETREKIYPLMTLLHARAPEDYKVSATQLGRLIYNAVEAII